MTSGEGQQPVSGWTRMWPQAVQGLYVLESRFDLLKYGYIGKTFFQNIIQQIFIEHWLYMGADPGVRDTTVKKMDKRPRPQEEAGNT